MRNKLSHRIALSILATTLLVGLAACGSKDEKMPASQVAAKVNSEEISVHQINFVLGRSNTAAIPPEQAPRIRREILNKLIDQQLAVDKAIENKIDRKPEVQMAIEAARREILARAYLEKIASAQPKPTPEEAKKYIAEHPQLFAERRIFNIQEIVLPASSNATAYLREMVAADKSMDDIANWLKSKDIKISGGSATRPAEQIPLDLLPKVHALKDGQGLLLENSQTITVMRLAASQSAPITEAVAIPRVQQFLGNQRAGEAAASEFKQLKANAKITYMGEFAESAAAPVTTGTPATAPAKTPAPVAEKKPASPNLEKGVAGLK